MEFLQEVAQGGSFSTMHIVTTLVLSFVLASMIALFYKKTHKGLSYSQSFVFTLILLTVVVSMVMMVIGNSLARAFALLGAFSIIRFRTPVKDTKDTAFIFFALAMGMAVGTDNYNIAIIATGVILGMIWLLDYFDFGSIRKHEYLLSFIIGEGQEIRDSYDHIFKKYVRNSLLLNITSKREGGASELTYHITFFDDTQAQLFVKDLGSVSGVTGVHLITSKEDVEY